MIKDDGVGIRILDSLSIEYERCLLRNAVSKMRFLFLCSACMYLFPEEDGIQKQHIFKRRSMGVADSCAVCGQNEIFLRK